MPNIPPPPGPDVPDQPHPVPDAVAVADALHDLDMADPRRQAFDRKVGARGQLAVAAQLFPAALDGLELRAERLGQRHSPVQHNTSPPPRLGGGRHARNASVLRCVAHGEKSV